MAKKLIVVSGTILLGLGVVSLVWSIIILSTFLDYEIQIIEFLPPYNERSMMFTTIFIPILVLSLSQITAGVLLLISGATSD